MTRTGIRNAVHSVCEELDLPKIPVIFLFPTMACALHR